MFCAISPLLQTVSALQTPTPHPNALCVPRACASRPVRGPLDDHFRPLCQRVKRSASLPSGMDSCTRKVSQLRSYAGGAGATGHHVETPAFTGLDPRPCARAWPPAASDVAPTSADFGILHKPVPNSSSSEQGASCHTASSARTTRSLTPRLGSLAVSVFDSAAGHIDTQMGTADTDSTLAEGARTVQQLTQQQPWKQRGEFAATGTEMQHEGGSVAAHGRGAAGAMRAALFTEHAFRSDGAGGSVAERNAGHASAGCLARCASTPAALEARDALQHVFQSTLPLQPLSRPRSKMRHCHRAWLEQPLRRMAALSWRSSRQRKVLLAHA